MSHLEFKTKYNPTTNQTSIIVCLSGKTRTYHSMAAFYQEVVEEASQTLAQVQENNREAKPVNKPAAENGRLGRDQGFNNRKVDLMTCLSSETRGASMKTAVSTTGENYDQGR